MASSNDLKWSLSGGNLLLFDLDWESSAEIVQEVAWRDKRTRAQKLDSGMIEPINRFFCASLHHFCQISNWRSEFTIDDA